VTTIIEGGAGGGPGAASAAAAQLPPLTFVNPSELPDYRPAFAPGATRADADGRLWIRTIPTKPLAGGPEYDILDGTGALVDRVAIPRGSTIVGFGAGGIVYLGVRDASGVRVVKARMK
jgi:hypothetical protein